MSAVAVFHTVLGSLALASGAVVLLRPKGGHVHRTTGKVHVGAMVVLCLASFSLQDSTPFFRGFGGFHVAALISLATVSAGAWEAWRRRPGWLSGHLQWMAWSYIGLVMATGGHVSQPVYFALRDVGLASGAAIGLSLFIVWGLPPIIGSRLIARRVPTWEALGARVAPGSIAA